jgi:hypothetical protein
MRKIEQEMISAIVQKKDWRKDNTSVSIGHNPSDIDKKDGLCIIVTLHGNFIAELKYQKEYGWTMWLTNSGWATRTTHSRLNAIIKEITGLSDRFTSKNSKNRTFSKLGYGSSWKKVS